MVERDKALCEMNDKKRKFEQLQLTVDNLKLKRSRESKDYESLAKMRDNLTIEKDDLLHLINQLQTSLDKATKNKENAETNALKLNFALTELKQTTIKEHKILTSSCASLERQVAKTKKYGKN